MLTLPPEIINNAFSFLPTPLAPYAGVSKQWQGLIERRTFSEVHLTTARLPDFQRIVGPSRYSIVRQIQFITILPEYEIAARSKFEGDEDRERNNQAFSMAISSLFHALHSWPDRSQVTLTIFAQSPSDWYAEPDKEKRMKRYNMGNLWGRDLLDHRYERSYLQWSAQDMPSVNAVVALNIIGEGDWRRIAPAAVARIACRLPRLRKIDCMLCDNERKDLVLRDSLRDEFALSLRDWPASIEHLHLEYRCDPPLNENKIPPRRSEAGKDALCLALHRLSHQLVTLELEEITIGPELFWPPGTQKNSPPQWPKLTRLMVTYMSATPSGQWLFERDPRCPIWNQEDEPTFEEIAEGQFDHYVPAREDYPVDRFRSKPLPLMNEIYKAAGLAAQHMPLLEDMAMAAQIQGTIIEVRQGSAEHLFRYTRETARVKWVGMSEFHPTKEVMDIWKGVGREHGLDRVQVESIGLDHLPALFSYDLDDDFFDKYRTEEHGYVLWDTS
ncbi:hypothetical protein ATEIFO6365_0007003200 [Aspergillus terreus]|uniref:DUF6546 domain-containing protein n=1 Tax=Aspergillus terreus TaxID=33178 RepID=A0A5M3Z420_ASPTE|nr:hypothetical protein ATETN484_0009003200 [Aspergillus terreus]GFF17483.1 hypothetical protein ATEIFO6365_0007003200 [Aspergillus terreus]